IVAAVTIILLSAVGEPQIQAEQPERTQPIITSEAATTTLEAKEKMTTVPVMTKPTTSITTAQTITPTATTTTSTTTSEVTNTTTAPTTVEKEKETTTTTQPPLKVVTTDTTPANGTVRGDKIYVCGFGWIDYEGGGGIGEANEQMYQNGNKIGYFGGHINTAKQTQKTKTTQPPDKSVTAEATPANGTVKGDMIYIIGFGWVENEGGGGEGTYDHEMKTNGNKICYFG
ncbi:MAG: DUF6550 family protein, partial [Ruminiclostridium sp.]